MSHKILETADGGYMRWFFETDKTSGESGGVLEKVKVFEALSLGKTWILFWRFLEVPAVERVIWKMY